MVDVGLAFVLLIYGACLSGYYTGRGNIINDSQPDDLEAEHRLWRRQGWFKVMAKKRRRAG